MGKSRVKFHSLLRSSSILDKRLATLLTPIGIEPKQARILNVLNRIGPSSQKTLAEQFDVTSGSMSTMIDRLLAAGLVHRKKHPNDKRTDIVSLSGRGREVRIHSNQTRTRKERMMRQLRLGLIGTLILVSGTATAEAPNLQTPKPVIYLADNLDEKDNLGWCIDTLGRGFGDNLQTHSCKPRGGDVQFSFEEDAGLIRSVAYPDYCMQYNGGDNPVFGLVTCDATNSTQAFSYNSETMAISPADDAEQCVSVGQASKSAGPFMSRTLELTACAETDAPYRQWIVADG